MFGLLASSGAEVYCCKENVATSSAGVDCRKEKHHIRCHWLEYGAFPLVSLKIVRNLYAVISMPKSIAP